jgi:hypothetical protein
MENDQFIDDVRIKSDNVPWLWGIYSKNPTKVDPDAVADIAVASQGSIPETSLIIQIKCPKAPMPSMIDRHIHIEIAMSGCTPICDKSKFHYCWWNQIRIDGWICVLAG